MEQIKVHNLTFAYEGAEENCLRDVSFSVEKGEMVLLIGPSGCGKTTLLRHLKREYTPCGNREGSVGFQGQLFEEMDERSQAAKIGFVGQNVEAANATDKVWHELAFGLEGLGYAQKVMQRRVAEITAFFGLEDIYYASVDTLSGGQKQLVALASVMVMEPELLVLDEPTSQLDPVAAGDFLRMLQKINQELGTTIIMTEHRLEESFSLCDRVLVMEQGRLVFDGSPCGAVAQLYGQQNCMYKAMPTAARLFMEMEDEERKSAGMEENTIPLNIGRGAGWLKDFCERRKADDTKKRLRGFEKKNNPEYALQGDELWFHYEGSDKDVLKACNISLEKGKVTALLGGNGTGKSTLLHVLAGHEKNYQGKIRCGNREKDYGEKGSCESQEKHWEEKKRHGNREKLTIGMLPQNPQAMFAKHTVYQELLSVSEKVDGVQKLSDASEKVDGVQKLSGVSEKRAGLNVSEKIDSVVELFGLQNLLERHPFDLSGGEMQKLGLAKLLLADYDILLLDEPGKAMDFAAKEEMGKLLLRLAENGKTILLVSHDVEFCARFAQRCGLFFDGHVVSVEESKDFFRQNVFYTTAIRRICKDEIPEAVVFEDVTDFFGLNGGEEPQLDKEVSVPEEEQQLEKKISVPEKEQQFDKKVSMPQEEQQFDKKMSVLQKEQQTEKMAGEKRGRKKHIWSTLLIFLVLMPVTIYIGETFLQHRKYYFISVLLVLEAIAAFFLSFEKRKPKTREIMVVAMLCAITVAGRAAFYMVPNVKPMAALVILSGVSLGGEVGFLVGALSMLVSNIFFGQGPWTPWQMFAMGVLGLLAGLVFRQKSAFTGKKRLGICLFGLVSVVVLYGGIMNLSSVILYQDNVNLGMILAACGLGLPFDLIHGVSTFLFLFIGAGPMLQKLERVKKKYGF